MIRKKDINWSCKIRGYGQCEFWIPLFLPPLTLAEAHPVFSEALGVIMSNPLPVYCCLFLKHDGWGRLLGGSAGMT